MTAPQVLVISGAAGVGKSSTAYEVSTQLQSAGVAHAVVDSDELDHIFPVPPDLARLTERNLKCVWSGFSERGVTRLVLVGVYLHRPSELEWIGRAIPGAHFTLVRLVASDETLADRLGRREIGSGFESQLERTARQQRAFEHEQRSDVHLLATDAVSVQTTAQRIIAMCGWIDDG